MNLDQVQLELIEDDESLRQSILNLLQGAGFRVRSWCNAEDFLQSSPPLSSAVVITDMRMPGLSGLELHARLQSMGSAIPVIYISAESTPKQTISAMKLGAHEFLIKPFSRAELIEAVSSAIQKERGRMQRLDERKAHDARLNQLSPREREVMDLMVKGFGNAQIMTTLGISLPTAKQYKSQIMRKLDVQSLAELMAFQRRVDEGNT